MWVENARTGGRPSDARPATSDLGTQLEDLLVHVFDCEKWASCRASQFNPSDR